MDRLRRAFASMEGPSPHPDLRAFLSGSRTGEAEAHLASCDPCRRGLVALHRRRRIPLWAAAASILLALGLFQAYQSPRPLPPASLPFRPAPPVGLSPPELRGGEALHGPSALLTLEPGGRVRRKGQAWELLQGTLLAETGGETVPLAVGSLELELLEGALSLEAGKGRPTAFLLAEAWASEAGVRVTLHRGRARAGARMLEGPSGWSWDGSNLESAPARPEPSSWTALDPGPPLRESRRVLLPSPPAQGYVLEALIRKRDLRAESAASFEAFGQGWEIPLGGDLLPAGEAWRRLRVTVDPAGCQVFLGGKEALRETASTLPLKASPVVPDGSGIRAWGGAVEIRDARWRPIR